MRTSFRSRVLALTILGTLLLFPPSADAGDDPERVKLVPLPDGGRPVVARTDDAGTIHVLYDSPEGPKYVTSTNNGATFAAPISVVDTRPQPTGLVFSAWDLALGRGGRVHVAMGTNAWKLKLPQEEWGFYYASLDPGAKSFSPVRNINRKPSEGFSLAADAAGNVTACWLSGRLYANVSYDGGKTFGPNAEIDAGLDPCDCCTTSAAYGADGRLAVLYREETDDDRDMYLVLWDQAAGRTSRTRIGVTPWSVNACPMTYYAVTRDRAGYLAVWPTKGDVYFTRLDGTGNPTLAEEIKTPGHNGMRTGVLALSAPDGSTLVAWKKDGRLGWQLYDSGGRALGPPGSAGSPSAGAAGVVAKDGNFVLFR